LRATHRVDALGGLLALCLRRWQDRAGEWIQLAHIYEYRHISIPIAEETC